MSATYVNDTDWLLYSDYCFFVVNLVSQLDPIFQIPPGIMSVLDDVCFTVHASEGSDRTLMEVMHFKFIKYICSMICRKDGNAP